MTPEQIKDIRFKLGLSQEQLAAALGVSFVTVNRWETSKAKPTTRHVRELATISRAGQHARVESSQPPPLRPIHYLGSKLRLADEIRKAVAEVAGPTGPVCDLFAGSGTVAHALAGSRPVVAVDIQEYSRVLLSALLSPWPAGLDVTSGLVDATRAGGHFATFSRAMAPLVAYERECFTRAASGDIEPLCDLVEYGSLFIFNVEPPIDAPAPLLNAMSETVQGLSGFGLMEGNDSLVCRYFGGIYFSYAQAIALDAILEVAHARTGAARDLLLAAVLSTASEIVNTVGKQFAQPIRLRTSKGEPKAQLIKQTLRDRSYDVFAIFENWLAQYAALPRPLADAHRVVRDDYREFLAGYRGDFACIYADPPYTRDHYSRFYHVLETLCLRDTPAVSTMRKGGRDFEIMRGLYRVDRHQSPFCIKSQAPSAFEELFVGARRHGTPLILSYSPFDAEDDAHPRMMGIADLKSLAERYYSQVEIRTVSGVSHSKLNAERLHKKAAKDSEMIFLCRP